MLTAVPVGLKLTEAETIIFRLTTCPILRGIAGTAMMLMVKFGLKVTNLQSLPADLKVMSATFRIHH